MEHGTDWKNSDIRTLYTLEGLLKGVVQLADYYIFLSLTANIYNYFLTKTETAINYLSVTD